MMIPEQSHGLGEETPPAVLLSSTPVEHSEPVADLAVTPEDLNKVLEAKPTEEPGRFTQTMDLVRGTLTDAHGAAIHVPGGSMVPIYHEELIAAQLGVPVEKVIDLKRGIQMLNANTNVKQVMAFRCAVTKEVRLFFVAKSDTPGDIVNRWIRFMPEEAYAFKIQMAERRKEVTDGGMSVERTMRLSGEIPDNLYWAIRILDEHFWRDKKAYTKFLQEYPYFGPKG